MPLNNSLIHDILHSLCMHSVLICYILYGEETNEDDRSLCFSYSILREIARGMKRIWDSQMGGTTYSARIIQDDDLALKALKMMYHTNGASFEGLADRNVYRRKEVGEGENVSRGGAQTKGEVCKCKPTKNIFFHNDLLQLCLN